MPPTIAYDDVCGFIHAKSKGTEPNRTMTWHRDRISELSVLSQINSALGYLAWFVGSDTWNSVDPNTQAACQRLALLYCSAYVLTALSGGLIITGFNKTVGGESFEASERGKIYLDVITPFLAEAEVIRVALTQFNIVKSPGSIAAP
jgi:hypothetical protein